MLRPVPSLLALLLILATTRIFAAQVDRRAIVSMADQKIAIVENGNVVARFPVSTSRYGVGDGFNSYTTPLGELEIAGKIGDGAPLGAVFHNRRMTGEILRPNATGRDPIVTRILWLRGLERRNENAFSRNIYIHGTPVERLIGQPASFGCIRMRSRDVVQLFDLLPVGGKVDVTKASLRRAIAGIADPSRIAFPGVESGPRLAEGGWR